ncbi:transposase [Coraliomargarita algicola]|uniref:Transposase n=1 Tax=Coraliomargarita algicola TaxID=3092156 RepID=A0ABZ0RPR7_9BACT|nr:transposase [Coraliomargarita sp. J2-16]WPJ97116.1 transposase [Coraliomargarita sp. J2-16]
MSEFLNPYAHIDQHGLNLPHWQQGEAFVFVTWRMADSLPENVLRGWSSERRIWFEKQPLPWDASTRAEYRERFPLRIERWLDPGSGSCALSDPTLRLIVEGALSHFEGERHAVRSYVIMPNHVHILFQPLSGCLLEDILHTWKSYSSQQIMKTTKHTGEFWSAGYWDRLIRDRTHFERCVRYIRNNPAKAKLNPSQFSLYENEALTCESER